MVCPESCGMGSSGALSMIYTVLDYFIMITSPGGLVIMSALHVCLVVSNDLTVCGVRFD